MKILVAGGAGFIGSHLCDSLLEQGHDVVVADKLIFGGQDIRHLLENEKLKESGRFRFYRSEERRVGKECRL